ncbi:MAG: hypothetical protein KME08_14300 [Aphanothece sp. CMT-3BRIN-NPC111]|nr:hypothetical protein [Aphanothece sp. CMT-3BRIN-NPC111]
MDKDKQIIYSNQKYSLFPAVMITEPAQVFLLLAIITWIAHFWHSNTLGLYGDDYVLVAPPMTKNVFYILPLIINKWRTFSQGRPICFSLIALFSFLGAKLGGLAAVYWFAYIIHTLNSFLFYTLMKRLFNKHLFPIIGALAFSLFPADTTHAYLTHLGVYPSLTFLLVAFHYYFSQRKQLSYLVIIGSFLSYETVFPIFLAAPLLNNKWNTRLLRELIQHTLILGGMIVCIVIIRKVVGDHRITDLNFMSALIMSITHMFQGPITSLKMLLYRPIETLRSFKGELLVFVPLCFIGLTSILYWLKFSLSENALRLTTSSDSRSLHLEMYEFFKKLAKLGLVGLIMLVLAYPLTLTVPATTTEGGGTRVHLAAVVGASIICACLCSAILFIMNVYRQKNIAIAGISAFFALLVGFGLVVQQDYRLSWQYQQAFWTDLIQLCPDMTTETIILVDPTDIKQAKHIYTHLWSNSFVLPLIYNLSPDKIEPRIFRPIVFLLRKSWQEKIVSTNNLFQLNEFTVESLPFTYTQINSSNVILLKSKHGKLVRITQPLIISDKIFQLKQKSISEIPSFPKGYFYEYLIKPSDANLKKIVY